MTPAGIRGEHDEGPHQLRAGDHHPRRRQGVHPGDQTLSTTFARNDLFNKLSKKLIPEIVIIDKFIECLTLFLNVHLK